MSIVKNDGRAIDVNNSIFFVALIRKNIKVHIQKNLLQSILDINSFLLDNKGKKVKYIKIIY